MLKGLHEPGRGLAVAPREEEKAPGRGGGEAPGAAQWGWEGGLVERRLHSRELESNSAGPGDRTPVHSPGSGLARDRQRPGGPRTTRTLLPRAEQIRGPGPEPPELSDGLLRSNWGG